MKIKKEIRTQLIQNLNSIDNKLKFQKTTWNDEVKAVFSKTGSFCFENLVYTNFNEAQSLYIKFKA